MKTHIIGLTAAASVTVPGFAGAQSTRDYISIVGSSTVYPFAAVVAEHFGKATDYETPTLESTGSGGGMKLFCAGVGVQFPDITNASRRIKKSEFDTCRKNGVKDVVELKIGYDGIAIANSKKAQPMNFTLRDIFLALAKEVPDPKGTEALVANPYKTWKEVNDKLPDWPIVAYIPGEKHGTREVFEEKVLEKGCEAAGGLELQVAKAGGDEKAGSKACMKVRKDGAAVDIDGDYTETLARIDANPDGIGVFGLAFYENNTDKLKVATMSSIAPSTETIASGEYPVSRPLFFYIKKAHIGVIPGLKEYAQFFVSDEIAGPNGPLANYGLVSDPELAETQAMVADENTM